MHSSRMVWLAGAGLVALVLGSASSASASHGPVAVFHGSVSHQNGSAATACYAQMAGDGGVGVISQNFPSGFDAYDSLGADDFRLTQPCHLRTVTVLGVYFDGSGPADSFNVAFYHRRGTPPGTPGKVFIDKENLAYTGLSSTQIGVDATLTKGGWVSVQANMDFSTGGEWGWVTNKRVRFFPSQWENPGGGFGGCTTWCSLGGDFAFSLR